MYEVEMFLLIIYISTSAIIFISDFYKLKM